MHFRQVSENIYEFMEFIFPSGIDPKRWISDRNRNTNKQAYKI